MKKDLTWLHTLLFTLSRRATHYCVTKDLDMLDISM